MDDAAVFALVAEERRRLVTMLSGLSDEQWAAPSLCSRWTVRDLGGHLALPFVVSKAGFVVGMVRHRGDFDAFSVKASKTVAQRSTAEIVQIIADHADSRFTPPGNGPTAPLTDTIVHTRDIARPLGLDVCAPPSTWRVTLDFLLTPRAARGFAGRGRFDGLALSTSDQNWSHGDGARIHGTSEAVAMAMLGRTAALADLEGDGVEVLRSRLG